MVLKIGFIYFLHCFFFFDYRIWPGHLSPIKTHPDLCLLHSVSLLISLNLNSRCLLRNRINNEQNSTRQMLVLLSLWIYLILTIIVFSFLSPLCFSWSQWTVTPVSCRVRNNEWHTTDDSRQTRVKVCETHVLLSSLSSLGDLAGLGEFVTPLLTDINKYWYKYYSTYSCTNSI